MTAKRPNYARRYVLVTYLAFWFSVALVAAGFLASGRDMRVLNWGSALASWTPTMVLLIMFRQLLPATTVKDWLKQAFSPRVPIGLMLVVTAVLCAAMAATVGMVALRTNQPALSLLNLSLPTLASAVFFTLIQGATGEEAGWRGYLQPIMEKTAGGVIKGSLLVGVVWSFWHTPLWLASGMLGWNLAIYVSTFIIGNLSLSVIIGVCYHRCKNLAVPMWIHFVSNLVAAPYVGDPIEVRWWLVLFYMLAAVGFSSWHAITADKPAQSQRPLGLGA